MIQYVPRTLFVYMTVIKTETDASVIQELQEKTAKVRGVVITVTIISL